MQRHCLLDEQCSAASLFMGLTVYCSVIVYWMSSVVQCHCLLDEQCSAVELFMV